MTQTRRSTPKHTTRSDLSSGWIFFRQWLKNPLKTAALSPSGRQLARHMIAELPPGARRVIELGGGTGVFTQAMIQHGIAPKNLLVLELNEALFCHLHSRFPDAHVVCGDARQLHKIAQDAGYLESGAADAIISGLGLLSMPRSMQRDIINAAFSVLAPEGCMIQFTYGPTCPVPSELLQELGLSARRASFAWRNLPPASVYVFSRNRSKAIHAVKMNGKSK